MESNPVVCKTCGEVLRRVGRPGETYGTLWKHQSPSPGHRAVPVYIPRRNPDFVEGERVAVPSLAPVFLVKKVQRRKGEGLFGGAKIVYRLEMSVPGAKPRTISIPASEVRRLNPAVWDVATCPSCACPIEVLPTDDTVECPECDALLEVHRDDD